MPGRLYVGSGVFLSCTMVWFRALFYKENEENHKNGHEVISLFLAFAFDGLYPLGTGRRRLE